MGRAAELGKQSAVHSGGGGVINILVTGLWFPLCTPVILRDAFDPVVGVNSTANVAAFHVLGNKADAAVTVVGVIASIVAYIKGLLNQVALVKVQTDKIATKMEFTPIPDWSVSQLTATIAQAAGTLALPSVVVATIPAGATIVKARAILTSRTIYNTNAGVNKLDGATVAATSQVIQINKGGGAWADCINFIDDQFQQPGLVYEGGVFVPGTIDLSAIITGNDTYNFRWLLAKADQDSIVMQGVKMAIQYTYYI